MKPKPVTIYTIGYTKKTAEEFFKSLRSSNTTRIIDVRLNNISQLAGFTKRCDIAFFLREICGIDYLHLPEFAPTQPILDEYRKSKRGWAVYEKRFLDLLEKRRIEDGISKDLIDGACLLCSEDKPHFCHRRLVAEYLKERWGNVEIHHLV